MNKQRPVFLNLFQIKFPPAAIISILHRITGIVMFLYTPFLMWAAHLSLQSGQRFQEINAILNHGMTRFFVWIFLAAVLYHVIAGIRHLLMDMGIGESKQGGRIGAYIVLILAVIFAVLAGVWIYA